MVVIKHHNHHAIAFFKRIGEQPNKVSLDGLTEKGYVRFMLDSFGNRIWDEYNVGDFAAISISEQVKMVPQFRKQFVPWQKDQYEQYRIARLKDIGSQKK